MKNFKSILKNLWGTKEDRPARRGLHLESLEDRQMLSTVGWDLGAIEAAAGFDTFELRATVNSDGTVDADLVAIGEKTEVSLGAKTVTPANDTIEITGKADAVDNITIAETAMTFLKKIDFKGNAQDNVTVVGSANDDTFAIDTESEKTTVTQDVVNPYAQAKQNLVNYMNAAKAHWGENSPIYKSIEFSCTKTIERYDAAAAAIKPVTTVITNQRDTISFSVEANQYAQLTVNGLTNVTINAGEGNDTFNFKGYSAKYNLDAGAGNDAIAFAEAEGRAVINMGLNTAQAVVAGETGTIRVNDTFETVVGTKFNDVITTGANTVNVMGIGGSDTVLLVGNANTNVVLNGAHQTVTATGSGNYVVMITDGSYSVVNGSAIAPLGTLSVYFFNTTGSSSDYVTVFGSNGNDTIFITGTNAKVYANGGDDLVEVTNAAGAPAPLVNINYVYGGDGNDQILLAGSTGTNYIYGGNGNDLMMGGSGMDFIFAMTGNNILIGGEGTDYLYGSTGRDILIANTMANINDLVGLYALWADDASKVAVDDVIAKIGKESVKDGKMDVLSGSTGADIFFDNKGWEGDFDVSTCLWVWNQVEYSNEKDA